MENMDVTQNNASLPPEDDDWFDAFYTTQRMMETCRISVGRKRRERSDPEDGDTDDDQVPVEVRTPENDLNPFARPRSRRSTGRRKSICLTEEAQQALDISKNVGTNPKIVKHILRYLTDAEIRNGALPSKLWMRNANKVFRERIGNKPFVFLWQMFTRGILQFSLELGNYLEPSMLKYERDFQFEDAQQYSLNPVKFIFLFGTDGLEPLLRDDDGPFNKRSLKSLPDICSTYGINAVFLTAEQLICTSPLFTRHFVECPSKRALQSLCLPESPNISIQTFSIHNSGLTENLVSDDVDQMLRSPFCKQLKALIILEFHHNDLFHEVLAKKLPNHNSLNNQAVQVMTGVIETFGTQDHLTQPACTAIRIFGNSNLRTQVIGFHTTTVEEYQFQQLSAEFFRGGEINCFAFLTYSMAVKPPLETVDMIKRCFPNIPFIGFKSEHVGCQGFEYIKHPFAIFNRPPSPVNLKFDEHYYVLLLVAYN